MTWIDILIIISIIVAVLLIISYLIYKKIKGQSLSDCECCSAKGKNLIKSYNKKYKTKIKFNSKNTEKDVK